MSASTLSIASIIAAVAIVVIILFITSASINKVKLELKAIKDMLIKVANGTFDGDMAPPQIKQSAEIMTALKSIAKDVKQQQQAVTHFAYVDELTGMPNKRRFNEELIRSFDFAKRGMPVCIVTAEISDIKKINSESGRATSDRVIKLMADIIKTKTRKTDFSARLGDDDFAMVLPNMNDNKIEDWLTEMATNFNKEQQQEKILPENQKCDIKFGYSFVNEKMDREPQQVLDRATTAMAKIMADNQTIVMQG